MQVKSEVLTFRVSNLQKAFLQAWALELGVSVSDLVLATAIEARKHCPEKVAANPVCGGVS